VTITPSLPWLVLLLVGLGFLGFGAAYTLWPARMAGFTEIALPTATAKIDFIATYGGFQLGIGLFLLICAFHVEWGQAGLGAGFASLAGFGLTRAIAILRARARVRRSIWFALGLEWVGATLCLWALVRSCISHGGQHS
jgi:hypothetical protein